MIKAVRELTSLGLKEAKDLVDGAPKPILEKASKEDAEAAKAKLAPAVGEIQMGTDPAVVQDRHAGPAAASTVTALTSMSMSSPCREATSAGRYTRSRSRMSRRTSCQWLVSCRAVHVASLSC